MNAGLAPFVRRTIRSISASGTSSPREYSFTSLARPSSSGRSEEHRLNSSHLVISYAVFCLKKKSVVRSEEHTSELQSACNLVCRLLLEKKNIDHSGCTRTRRLLQRRWGYSAARRSIWWDGG